MSERHTILIDPGGRLTFVYDDAWQPLLEEGPAAVCRASHVEPARAWATGSGIGPAGWMADLSPVGGPALGPFARRADALAAERAWLEVELLGDREMGTEES